VGQFSPDAWMMLYARNIVNAACKPNVHGTFQSRVSGAALTRRSLLRIYRTVFVQKEPFDKPENAKRDSNAHGGLTPMGNGSTSTTPRCTPTSVRQPWITLSFSQEIRVSSAHEQYAQSKRDKMLLGLDGLLRDSTFQTSTLMNM